MTGPARRLGEKVKQRRLDAAASDPHGDTCVRTIDLRERPNAQPTIATSSLQARRKARTSRRMHCNRAGPQRSGSPSRPGRSARSPAGPLFSLALRFFAGGESPKPPAPRASNHRSWATASFTTTGSNQK